MVRRLEAIYQDGVLRPLQPLSLIDQQRVLVTIEDELTSTAADHSEPDPERREEMQWIADNAHRCQGQWLAIDRSRLVAAGADVASVNAAAHAAGIARPLLYHVPAEDDQPFGGW